MVVEHVGFVNLALIVSTTEVTMPTSTPRFRTVISAGWTSEKERKGSLVVARDVPFRFCSFVEQRAFLFHVHFDPCLKDRLTSVGSGHTESLVPVVQIRPFRSAPGI